MCPMCEENCDPWTLSDSCVYAKVCALLIFITVSQHVGVSLISSGLFKSTLVNPNPYRSSFPLVSYSFKPLTLGVKLAKLLKLKRYQFNFQSHCVEWIHFRKHSLCSPSRPSCPCVCRWPICLTMAALCSLQSSWLFGVSGGCFLSSIFLFFFFFFF